MDMLKLVGTLVAVFVGGRIIENCINGEPLLQGRKKRQIVTNNHDDSIDLFYNWAFPEDCYGCTNITEIWNLRHGNSYWLDPRNDEQSNLKKMVDYFMKSNRYEAV